MVNYADSIAYSSLNVTKGVLVKTIWEDGLAKNIESGSNDIHIWAQDKKSQKKIIDQLNELIKSGKLQDTITYVGTEFKGFQEAFKEKNKNLNSNEYFVTINFNENNLHRSSITSNDTNKLRVVTINNSCNIFNLSIIEQVQVVVIPIIQNLEQQIGRVQR